MNVNTSYFKKVLAAVLSQTLFIGFTTQAQETLQTVTDRGYTTTHPLHIGGTQVNSNTTKLFIKNATGKTWALSSGANMISEMGFYIYNWSDNPDNPLFSVSNGGNIGIGSALPAAKLSFGNEANEQPVGITWSDVSPLVYGIHKTAGAWQAPNYQQLRLGWTTGIILDPGQEFGKSYVDIQGNGLRVSGGNVGIGTVNPENAEGWMKVLEVKGGAHSKSLVSTNSVISGLWSHELGYYGAPAGGISGTYTNHPFTFITNKVSRMTITNDGRVGIGVAAPPSDFQLAVAGKVIADELKVKPHASGWPDYVFKPGYQLMPLSKIESFIREKGHLPEMPRAAEVAKDGVELGGNQALLLKKIEELTLHLIQMEKRMNEQDKEIKQLKNKNEPK
jgi:hypothetical protein